MTKPSVARFFGATETAIGPIPHYPLRTNFGVVYCPVKLKLNANGKVVVPKNMRRHLPMPEQLGGKMLFVAPGGRVFRP